jgi:hypothetical protein
MVPPELFPTLSVDGTSGDKPLIMSVRSYGSGLTSPDPVTASLRPPAATRTPTPTPTPTPTQEPRTCRRTGKRQKMHARIHGQNQINRPLIPASHHKPGRWIEAEA